MGLALKQSQVARLADLSRLKVGRAELGQYVPRFDETVRLAAALKLSLSELAYDRPRPSNHLRGFAIELYQLGICDLEVSGVEAPGSLRRPEEVVVLAVRGDRPEPRVIEAMPLVLARQRLRSFMLDAFVKLYDIRVGPRLGWLCELTLSLARHPSFPVELRSQAKLEILSKKWGRSADTDSLGHPTSTTVPPIWKRRNISYAGRPEDFMLRTREVAEVYKSLGLDAEDD